MTSTRVSISLANWMRNSSAARLDKMRTATKLRSKTSEPAMNPPLCDRLQKMRDKVWTTAYLRALRRLPPHRAEQEANLATKIYMSNIDRKSLLTKDLATDYL